MRDKLSKQKYLLEVLQTLESGLYLIDTDLTDDEIEEVVKEFEEWSFFKEELLPSITNSTFEIFLIGLCWHLPNENLESYKDLLLNTRDQQHKECLIYNILIRVIRIVSKEKPSVLLLYGERDLTSFKDDDLAKLNAVVKHHSMSKTLLLSKQKSRNMEHGDGIVKQIKIDNNFSMEDRKRKVHITYKHDEAHADAMQAIQNGLNAYKIPYSIDNYDILYRDNIQMYEEEIGASDIVVMFVIPEYLKSLDCMYEMMQIFKNGNTKYRVYPVVDLRTIPRNGDGLLQIKSYWNKEKNRKADQIKNEPGNSTFILNEIRKIDGILKVLDEFWGYIVNTYTGSYEDIIANNADFLMKKIESHFKQETIVEIQDFTPTKATEPVNARRIVQKGDKSVYIEHNSGTINLN